MKRINQIWALIIHSTTVKVLVLYGVISVGLLAPMGSLTVLPNIMDTPNHVESIVQAKTAIGEHQFPLRVAPTLVNNWQYPLFQFYSPTPYMVGGFIYGYITKDNPYQAYALVLWLALVAGAFGIYLLSKQLVSSKKIAILAGAAYITTPYILLNLHARGGFTEVCSQAVLPFVLLFCFKSFSEKRVHWIILGALAWYLVITCHLITFLTLTVYIGLVAFLYLIRHLITGKYKQINLMGFVRVGVSFILGALLAGYYIIPVALFSGNGIEPPSSPSLTAFFTPLLTLLSPVLISQNPSQIETFTIHFYPAVGWVFILSFFCMLYYLTQGKKSQTTEVDENNRGLITILLVLFAVSFFLTWSPLDFWKYIPGSNFVQHSYRFLIHTSWIGALLFGFSLQYLFREFENKHILVGIFLLVLACVTYLPSTSQASSITLQDIKDKPILSTMDYLYYPELAKPDNNHAALSGKSIMIPNDETGLVRSKGRMVGDIQVPAGIDYIQLPILYYPNLMEINANGQVIDYYPVYNKDLPFYLIKGHVWLTGIKLSPGNYHITVDFNGIQWANTASVISWIFLFAGLVIICLFRLRNQHPDWV